MPDNEDYRQFFALLDRAESWTDEERALVEGILRRQRQMVDAAHPKDFKGRARLNEVVSQIEEAVRRYEAR